MIRIIREEEPSKPSTRLSTDESLPSLAALRQTEPRKLMAMLRGELDWVVMKCLEKHRERRYETANGLAATSSATWLTKPSRRGRRRRGIGCEVRSGGTEGRSIAASLVPAAAGGRDRRDDDRPVPCRPAQHGPSRAARAEARPADAAEATDAETTALA